MIKKPKQSKVNGKGGLIIPKPNELWKEVLEGLFPSFLNFFHPKLLNDIMLEKGYKLLDKEFNIIKVDNKEKIDS